MKSVEIVNLILSPQWTAKLLHHFLSGAQTIEQKGIKMELIYLIIPILNDPVMRRAIKKSASSTFYTSFVKNSNFKGDELLKLKNSILNKDAQVVEFKKYTNNGLVMLGNISNLEFSEFLNVKEVISYTKEPEPIRAICKSAHYLGRLFAKEDYKNIFWKLGITSI